MKFIELDDLREKLGFETAEVEAEASAIEASIAAYLLKELRLNKGLTQAQVAVNMGVSQRRVSAIERGDVGRLEVSTLTSYVAALGGSVHLVAELDGESVRLIGMNVA